ncbi:MAG TPA: hypothetical protein DIC56_24100 [Rhizobium sp.]|nr:hypothetical protein [Rhizobium sp.]
MSDTSKVSSSIVVLEAFEYVHAQHRGAYEKAGIAIDKRVEQLEPGMLVHILTEVSGSSEVITYRWLEIFQDVEGLRDHLSSAHVAEHVASLSQGLLAAPTDLVIYGVSGAEEREVLQAEFGTAHLRFASEITSFFR